MVIGDIIGKPGRLAVVGSLRDLRAELDLDLVIANGENLAAGAGLTPSLAEELFANGVDVITSGNHIWDKREIYDYLDSGRPVLRPLNYPDDAPGRGWLLHTLPDGDRVAVVNVMGRVFMNQLDSPFAAMDSLLDEAAEPLPPVRIVDFHCEITSEKNAMGWYLDGRVTAVLGTHTHVPTADARLLPKGTAYISDVGMTGPRDSVIGFSLETVLPRFLTHLPTRFAVADGPVTFNAVVIEAERGTGRATSITPAAAPDRGLSQGSRADRRPSSARPAPARPSSSLALAARLPIEILVADSRQVYRGMDIGTAKPDAGGTGGGPAPPARPGGARRAIQRRRPGPRRRVACCRGPARGRAPAGRWRQRPLPGRRCWTATPSARRHVRRSGRAARGSWPRAGLGAAGGSPAGSDPATPGAIDLRNPRRVERALERVDGCAGGSGAPPAEPWPGPVRLIGIEPTHRVLNRRIDERAVWLFANGLVDEVRGLLDAGHDPHRAPLTGHGYGEAARYLAGEWSLDEAVAVTARRTRQYAKRQRTWFRRDPRIVWLAAGDRPADDRHWSPKAERLLGELRRAER